MTVTKADVQRGVTVSIAALLTAFFGFASVTSAQVASISNTGPGSNNQIKSKVSQECDIYNKNNLNVNNDNHQYANTGDANVGGSWGAYNPAVWKAKGYSYNQWQAAVQAHMSSYQPNWGSHGGGNTNAGSATTGDASNYNSTNVAFNVHNGGAGDFCDFGLPGSGGGSGSIHTTGPHSNNQISSHFSSETDVHNKNNIGVNNANHQGAFSGDANVSGNTNAGGAGSGHAKNVNGTSVHGSVTNGGLGGGAGAGGAGGGGAGSALGGCSGSIGTTGPSSNNQIKCSTSTSTRISNYNNVDVNNSNYQKAYSGDANVSGNTNAGSAGTGSASNSNTTSTNVSINN